MFVRSFVRLPIHAIVANCFSVSQRHQVVEVVTKLNMCVSCIIALLWLCFATLLIICVCIIITVAHSIAELWLFIMSHPYSIQQYYYSVKLHLRHKQTNGERDLSVCLYVCPLRLSWVSILWMVEARCFIEILRAEVKNRDQPIITHEIWSVYYQENHYNIATRCHILKLKWTKFDSLGRVTVSLSLSVCVVDGV